ncbi:hypothetical protein L6R52_44440 [Myxococcota bacterium]|nr:hypothetical protein [Myxococcota bacterium]
MSMSDDPYRKQRILWFIGMNAIAIAIAVGLFASFLYGDELDVIFQRLTEGIFEYKLLVVLIAMSPLFASLLVGGAYAQRALRRKKREAAEAAEAARAPQAT